MIEKATLPIQYTLSVFSIRTRAAKKKIANEKMTKYRAENYNFVFATVEGKDKTEQIKNAVDWATTWLQFKKLSNVQGSVIFDIDDTIVDNNEKVIKDMFKFYKLCLSLNFTINIITARPESPQNRSATKQMLKKRGFENYEALYMMPANIQPTLNTISQYKYSARKDVALRHNIILNFGDMWTDHFKFPCHVNELKDRDVSECAIFFYPGLSFPCVKLPGTFD